MGQNNDIKLVKKVLKKKSDQYSQAELTYMRMQLGLLKAQRKAEKQARKKEQGFGNES